MPNERPFLQRILRQWESPPTWLALFLVLALIQSRALPLLPTEGAWRVVGMLLVAAGLAVFVSALVEFRRHRTTVLPREEPTTMIERGVYRWSRNPIYLADAMILAGAALWWDAASLVLVPVFVAVISRRFIGGEEVVMRARFGTAYDAYAARVRRWI